VFFNEDRQHFVSDIPHPKVHSHTCIPPVILREIKSEKSVQEEETLCFSRLFGFGDRRGLIDQ